MNAEPCTCARPEPFCVCFVPFAEQVRRINAYARTPARRHRWPDWLKPAGHSAVEPWTESGRTVVRGDTTGAK